MPFVSLEEIYKTRVVLTETRVLELVVGTRVLLVGTLTGSSW